MARAEREFITGVWGRSPQRVQGAEPWSEVQGAMPMKLVTFLYSKCISCVLLVAFCIGATTANFCKYSTLGKLRRKL